MVAKLPDTRALNSPNIGVNGFTPRLNVNGWSSGDAALAHGLEGFGNTLSAIGNAEQNKADSLAEATASADFSIAKDNAYTRLSTDPDYEKAPQAYVEEATKSLQESAARLPAHQREMFIQRGRVGIEVNANNLRQRAVTIGNQQTILDNDGRLNDLATQALSNPDETYRSQKLEEAQKILRGELEGRLITPKEYRARNKAFIEKYGESFGNDLINRDPNKALEQLDKIIPREAPTEPAAREKRSEAPPGSAAGYLASRSEVENYITQSAKARGIDPQVALTVYRHEGAGAWQSSVVKNGARERSYGPFQLYIDGGLGNKFEKDTGLDPRDPNTWRENIDFALDEAKKGGWGPWYGAKAAGITGRRGLDGQPVQVASLGNGTVNDASGPAKEPEGVQVAQAQTGTPLDFLRPDQILKLRQRAQQAIEKQERDAIKQSAIRGEEYERRMLDAAVGKGELPTREEIEADPALHITHKNTTLRRWAEHSKEAIATNAAFQQFRGGSTFNPYEKDDRKNADRVFQGMGGDDAALTAVLQRTGILPESAATKMRGDLISNDPKRVVGAMTRASNALSINQNAMTGFQGADDLEKNAVKYRTLVDDFGMTAEDAANRMIREQTPEFKSSVNAKLKNENIDDLIKKKVTVDDMAGQFDPSFLGLARNPQVGFSVRTRDAMFDQFTSLTKEHYLDMGAGNLDVAKKLAARDLKKTWGTSSVNGSSVVMQYPPERAPVYQGIEKASDLIAKEAIKTIKEETGQDADQKTLRIVPIPGVTAQAYKSGQVPPYALSWEDKNGILQMLRPGRAFVADPSSMRQQQTLERESEFGKARDAAGAERMIGTDPRAPFGVPQ